VSAYVTHGVFPKESWRKFKADNGGECMMDREVEGRGGGRGVQPQPPHLQHTCEPVEGVVGEALIQLVDLLSTQWLG
jgi:hypothetical protein